MARIRIRPYRVLAVIHGWAGFPLAVLFLVVCGSGLYLAVDDLVERYDRHGQTYRPLTLAEQVAGLEAMMQRYPAASTYSVPTPARPFFRASARGDAWLLSAETLEEIHRVERDPTALRRTMLGLHRNLLRGRVGREIVAWVTLIGLGLSVIGLVAWWPTRRTWRWRDTLPNSLMRSRLFRLHYTWGVILLLPLALLALTGAGITYRSEARDLLGAAQRHVTHPLDAPYYVATDWPERIREAQALMPDAEFAGISRPRRRGGGGGALARALRVRFVAPGDWHGSGASVVLLDEGNSAILGYSRFGDKAFGQQLAEMIRSLHDGLNMPNGYVLFLAVANGLVLLMTGAGLFSFFQKTYRVRLPKRRPARTLGVTPTR